MIPVAMESGRREDRGEPIQKLQGGEAESGAARGVGLREQVENLVGAAADQVEPFESEGRPGAIPDQPLQSLTVGSLDANTGVEAEPATVIPAEHVLGFVGFQEAVADHVAEEQRRR